MQFHIISIFPELFTSPLSVSLLKKAQDKGIVSCTVHDLRDYSVGKHRSTDDAPYGGGYGMVMKPEPVFAALDAVCQAAAEQVCMRRILLSPRGTRLTQEKVVQLAHEEALVLVCGRYEGVDERVRACVDEELSVGDYVLSGGEIAALVVIDAVARLIPGVLGSLESTQEESFSTGLLEYPHYTRPEKFHAMRVPEVLLSGNHAEIARWRRRQSLLRTREHRPDLLAQADLSPEEKKWLEKISDQQSAADSKHQIE
jgi:tRNA (guanine37-N1)-methyltransferase